MNICNKSGCFMHDLEQHNPGVVTLSICCCTCRVFFEPSLAVLGKSELKYLFCCRTKKRLSEFVSGFATFFFVILSLLCFILTTFLGDVLPLHLFSLIYIRPARCFPSASMFQPVQDWPSGTKMG